MKATIWGIKNLKKTEKRNIDTGVLEKTKRCTGTIEFNVLANEAGVLEDQVVEVGLNGKTDTTLEDLKNYCDDITQRQMLIMQTLKDIIEREEKC